MSKRNSPWIFVWLYEYALSMKKALSRYRFSRSRHCEQRNKIPQGSFLDPYRALNCFPSQWPESSPHPLRSITTHSPRWREAFPREIHGLCLRDSTPCSPGLFFHIRKTNLQFCGSLNAQEQYPSPNGYTNRSCVSVQEGFLRNVSPSLTLNIQSHLSNIS